MKYFSLLVFSFCCCLLAAQSECSPAGYTGEKKTTDGEGRLIVETYQDGMKHGLTTTYYLNGEVRQKTLYKLGKFAEVVVQPAYAREQKEQEELAKRSKPYQPAPHYNQDRSYYYCGRTVGKEVYYTKDSSRQLVTDCKQRIISERIKWKGNSCFIEKNYDTLGRLESKMFVAGKRREYNFFYGSGILKETNYSFPAYNGTLTEIKKYTQEGRLELSQKTRIREDDGSGYSGALIYTITCLFDENGKVVQRMEESPDGRLWVRYLPHTPGLKKWVMSYLLDMDPFYLERESEWKASTYPSKEYRSGYFANGEFVTDSIVDRYGNLQVKNGTGYYHGPGWLVEASPLMVKDTIRHPEGSGYIMYLMPQTQSGTTSYSRFLNYYEGRYLVPLAFESAKGSFKNGYKNGHWEYKNSNNYNNYYLYDSYENFQYLESAGVLYGAYEKGQRVGTWKFTHSYYDVELAYSGGICKQPQVRIKDLDPKREKKLDKYDQLEFKRLQQGGFGLGSYKNELLDGDMTFYRAYPDAWALKLKYKNGSMLDLIEGRYRNGNVAIQKIYTSDTSYKTLLYSPEGDPIEKDSVWYSMELREFGKKVNGKYEGKYLKWNRYTGDIHEKGYYSQGKRTGQWEHYYTTEGEDGGNYEQIISNYSDGVLHGSYSDIAAGSKAITGSYSYNRKDGLWKTTEIWERDTTYTEEMFDEGRRYLLHYRRWGKTCVKDGFGSIPSFTNVSDFKTEDFYEKGIHVKTVNTYTLSNHIESIVYKTRNGDSLAYYDPKGGGTCIKNGTGAKSYLDQNKVLWRVDQYEKGKLIKIDLYNQGVFTHTLHMYAGTDSTLKVDHPVLLRKIEPVSDGDTYTYKITLTICNITRGYKNFSLFLSTDVNAYDLADTSFFQLKPGATQERVFYHTQNTSKKQVTFSYYFRQGNPYYINEELFYTACLRYTLANGKEKEMCLNVNRSYHGLIRQGAD
jgi:hypothetical protein